MKCWQIILASVFFLTIGQGSPAQQVVAPGQPAAVPSSAAGPAVVNGQPYLQPSPMMIEPSPQVMPVYPPQSAVVPLPSQTPGSIFGPPVPPTGTAAVPPPGAVPLPAPPVVVGPGATAPGQPVAGGPANPITVPVVDDELAWDQIADVVSDYFRIAREQRARRGVEGWMEGRIDTVPRDSATWFEPHRQDSVDTFNRWESTFQSIRRRATVRVIPDAGSYQVEVIVEKEIEDLPRPEKSTAGAATISSDITLPNNRREDVSHSRRSSRWLLLGRDPALEQRMLAEIHARLNGVASARGSVFAR